MITITLKRSPNGYIRSFSATGHAGYARKGPDIVCAAITAITTTTIASLTDIAKLSISFQTEDGDIRCTTPPPEEMPSGQYLIARTLMGRDGAWLPTDRTQLRTQIRPGNRID